MNKRDLISSIADKSGLSKSEAGKAVDAVFDSISGALAKGDEIRLVGFGTFSVPKRRVPSKFRPANIAPLSEVELMTSASFSPGPGRKFQKGPAQGPSVEYWPAGKSVPSSVLTQRTSDQLAHFVEDTRQTPLDQIRTKLVTQIAGYSLMQSSAIEVTDAITRKTSKILASMDAPSKHSAYVRSRLIGTIE